MKPRSPLPLALIAFTTLSGLSAASGLAGQTADQILETAVDRYEARVSDIDNYTVVEEMNGGEVVAYYEKREVDGHPVFVRLDLADQALSRAGLTWMQLQGLMTNAFTQAGLQALAGELQGASKDELATLVASMGQRLAGPSSGDVAGAAKQALVDAGTDALKDAIVDAAVDAGLQAVASGIGGAAGPAVATLIQALRDSDGFGDALGNLAAALPRMAGAALPGGQSAGMPGMNSLPGGVPGGPMGADITSDPRSMALSAAASAGLGMLAGAGARAVRGLVSGDDVDESGDPYAVLRGMTGQVDLVGSGTLGDHPVWTLAARDPGALDLGGGDFTPSAVNFDLDRDRYVLREVRMEGEMDMEGERQPVAVRVTLDDYRDVDGLLHPFRTVTVFEGMQDAIPEEDRAEMTEQMEEMRRQMAAMEEQLEDMPPAQRRMVEQQLERMGGVEGLQARAEGQMGMLESGRMERVVRELRVNAGPPDPDAMSPIPGPGG